jgi:hypothetical protein
MLRPPAPSPSLEAQVLFSKKKNIAKVPSAPTDVRTILFSQRLHSS